MSTPTPPRKKPAALSFEQLMAKVQQAEDTLEAHERRAAADLRQTKASWKALWTPGRIVIAGLAAGFVIGRAEPLRTIGKGGSLMQVVSMLSGLFAGGSAQVAAEQAGEAAQSAEQAAGPSPGTPTEADDEAATLARGEATMQAARAAAVDPVEP